MTCRCGAWGRDGPTHPGGGRRSSGRLSLTLALPCPADLGFQALDVALLAAKLLPDAGLEFGKARLHGDGFGASPVERCQFVGQRSPVNSQSLEHGCLNRLGVPEILHARVDLKEIFRRQKNLKVDRGAGLVKPAGQTDRLFFDDLHALSQVGNFCLCRRDFRAQLLQPGVRGVVPLDRDLEAVSELLKPVLCGAKLGPAGRRQRGTRARYESYQTGRERPRAEDALQTVLPRSADTAGMYRATLCLPRLFQPVRDELRKQKSGDHALL
jgi:hypothetical protein